MPDKSLEQQIQDMLSGLEFKPDDKVWTVIKTEIGKDKKRRFVFWWWLLPVLMAGGIGAGVYLNHQPASKQHAQAVPQKAQTEKPGMELSVEKNNTSNKETGVKDDKTVLSKPIIAGEKEVNKKYETAQPAFTHTAGDKQHTTAKETRSDDVVKPASGKSEAIKPQIEINNNTANNTLNSGATKPDADLQKGEALVLMPTEEKERKDQVAKEESKEDIKEKHDSVMLVTAAPVVKPAKKNNWRFSAVADGGIAKLTKSILPSLSADKPLADYSASPGNGSGSSSQSYVRTYVQETPLKGYSFSLGVHAEKALDSRFSFITGLQYQYIHYTSRSYVSRDSFTYLTNSSSFVSAGQIASIGTDVDYTLHYLSIPLLFQYKVAYPVYFFAGLQNGIVLSAKRSERKVDYLSQVGLTTSAPVKNGFYTYQPAFTFGAKMAFYDSKKYTWFIAPHIDYGLSKTFKESTNSNTDRNNALRFGLQLSMQWKK